MTDTRTALAGPWQTIISAGGDQYTDLDTARLELGDEGEITISICRDSALPEDAVMPGSYLTSDVAYTVDDVYLGDDDGDLSAEAELARAEAMCAGLNAAGGAR